MSEHDVIYLKDRQNSPLKMNTPAAQPDSALSESNHRISNHLSLLASSVNLRAAAMARQGSNLDSDEVAAILHELSVRIDTIGRLHRLLATQPGSDLIYLDEFLQNLCETLVSALAMPGQVELVDVGDGHCPVDSAHALPLSLIVTEVVTNSLKYAHPAHVPGNLMVGCRRESDGSLEIRVDDDGVGLPEDFHFATDGGLGSRTIRALARQIGATAKYTDSGLGAKFRLRVPPARGSRDTPDSRLPR